MFQTVNPLVQALTTDIANYMWTSPVLTGNPIAPTPSASDSSTKIATTAFVKNQGYVVGSSLTANALIIGAGGSSVATTGGLGSSTTVLHGNSSGGPSFGAVNLSTDVNNQLGVANGGTGLSSGTSGGIPYFSGTTSIGSSGVLTANAPVLGGGAGIAPFSGSRSGNTTTYATTGTLVSGECVSIDASLNLVHAGGACTTGGGGGTVASSTAGQIGWFSSTGTTIVGNANITASAGAVTLGQSGTQGSLVLNGSGSQTVTIAPSATAGNYTVTLPGSGGSNAQLVQTNGSGGLSYTNIASDLTAGTADLTITGTTNATVGLTATTNAQAGGAYTFVAADNRKHVTRTNGSAQTDTLPQATGSFAAGWATTVCPTAAADTITPTTSTINGVATLVLGKGQCADIWADGTGNYTAEVHFPETVASAVFTVNSSGIPTITAGSATNVVFGNGTIGTIPNAALQNPSTTVAGQTCTLGSPCTIGVANLNGIAGGTVVANNTTGNAPPQATIAPVLGIAGSSTGSLGLAGATSGVVTIQAGAAAGTWTLQVPNSGGSSGQFLQTNGSGVTTWANAAGGGGLNSGSQYQLVYYATAGTTGSGSSGITTNANNNLVLNDGIVNTLRLVSDANDTLAATDYEVDFTGLTAARTEQLPACAAANKGQTFIVKDEAGKSFFFNITVSVASSGTIENATNAVINSNGASVTFACEGNGNYATI